MDSKEFHLMENNFSGMAGNSNEKCFLPDSSRLGSFEHFERNQMQ
jgi:hypothetical protein